MTLNKNKGTNRRITVMLLIAVLVMSLFAVPAAATEDGAATNGGNVAVTIDTENADHATVRVNGAEKETGEVSFEGGKEFKLDITADEGYFIRKILVVKENPETGDEEEEIKPLTNDKSHSEMITADQDMTIEVKITSEKFRFFDLFLPFDLFVFEWVQGIRTPVLTVLMKIITTLGDEGILFIVVGLIFLITKKYRKIGLAMLVALVVMLICNNFVLKEIFARERPFNLFETFPNKYHEWGGEKYIYPDLVKAPHSYSFPSGHTSSAFAAGIAVFLVNKKLGIPATLFAFVMGFTRIYVGVHYTTDVISAAVVGIIYAILGVLIANHLFPLVDKILDKILGKISEKMPKKKDAAAE